jgi:hypothetical protein
MKSFEWRFMVGPVQAEIGLLGGLFPTSFYKKHEKRVKRLQAWA